MDPESVRRGAILMADSELRNLLRDLVRIESPYFQERAATEYAAAWLEQRGVPVERHRFYAAAADFHGENLCGVIEGARPGPRIHLNGHLDTVRLCRGWTRPPYGGEIDGDRLYGVGALDMKGGAAAMMTALAALCARRTELRGAVGYSLVCGEEGPYGLGTTFLIADGRLGRAEGVISCEPAGAFAGLAGPVLGLGARGGLSYTLRIAGRAAHAAAPETGLSAIDDAARAVTAINAVAPRCDARLGRGSTCVVRIAGGGDACSVPDRAEVEVFRHIVRGESRETVQRETEAALRGAGLRCGWEIAFRAPPAPGFDGGFPPYVVAEDDPLVRRLARSAAAAWGAPPRLTCMTSIGDFNLLGGVAGLPTVLLGPGGARFHGPDEYVLLSDAERCREALIRFFTD